MANIRRPVLAVNLAATLLIAFSSPCTSLVQTSCGLNVVGKRPGIGGRHSPSCLSKDAASFNRASLAPARELPLLMPEALPKNRIALRGGGAGSDAAAADGGSSASASLLLSQAIAFSKAQMLPLGLLWAIAFGVTQPTYGVAVGKLGLVKYAPHAIFFMGGLVLKTDEAKEAIRATKAVAFGVLSTLLLTSVMGVKIVGALPLPVREFSLGAALFVCMPCTIQSGAVLSMKAGGNFALSLLITLLCSTGGIFTVPLVLDSIANLGGGIHLPVIDMVRKLVETVGFLLSSVFADRTSCMCQSAWLKALIPLIVAKLMSDNISAVKNWTAKNRPLISIMTTFCVVMTPWIQISKSAHAGVFSAVRAFDVVGIVGLLTITHTTFVLFNVIASRLMGLSGAMTKSVVFVASSKTLPLALSILAVLPARIGDKGLMALPCILGHFAQIVISSFLVSAWKGKDVDE